MENEPKEDGNVSTCDSVFGVAYDSVHDSVHDSVSDSVDGTENGTAHAIIFSSLVFSYLFFNTPLQLLIPTEVTPCKV